MAIYDTHESGNNIYVITTDMENRTPEEIARDFVKQICDLFDELIINEHIDTYTSK